MNCKISRPVVYHYTNAVAALKILETQELWATHIRYLNDSSELDHAFRILEDVCRFLLKSVSRDSVHGAILQSVSEENRAIGIDSMFLESYVTSFSTVSDDLSQWRAYSGKNLGVAIAFSDDAIGRFAEENNYEFRSCVYKLSEKRSMIEKIIRDELSTIHNKSCTGKVASDFIQSIHKIRFQVGKLARYFKDEKFEAEKEKRLVLTTGSTNKEYQVDAISIRADGHMVKPYFKVRCHCEKHQLLPIKSLTVGPSPHRQLNVSAFSGGRRKFNLPHEHYFDVLESKVPYRSW